MHLYKGGGTAQGNAMHSLIKASRYQLGLTGTIAGGYADHFFYTLFRLEPARMIKNGFRWTDEMAFCEKYGTIVRKYEYAEVTNGKYNSSSRGRQLSSPKVAPGISPLIFTDYLLDRAVFLDLSDMSRFLPELRENVVTIPTEKELFSSYNQIVKRLKELGRQKGRFGLLSKMLQFSLSYSDKPYGQQEIRNPSDGSVVCIPQSYEEYRNVDTLLNKEKKHPTQKPVNLYRWLLQKYRIPSSWKLLDTHVGSASSLIAFHEAGLQFVGFEKDKYMYELSYKRYAEEMAQIRLTDFL